MIWSDLEILLYDGVQKHEKKNEMRWKPNYEYYIQFFADRSS